MKFSCAQCGEEADRPAGHVNRSRRTGLNLYCSRICSGLGRRTNKTKAQKVEEKRIYDMGYREANLERITLAKRDYYARTKDREKEAIARKARMPRHVEYCRQPEYRKWKAGYDQTYRAKKTYGEYWECFLLTQSIRTEALNRMTDYDIRFSKGTLSKSQQRKRQAARAYRNHLEIGPLGDLKRGQRR